MRPDWEKAIAKTNQNVVEVESTVYNHLVNNHPVNPFSKMLANNVSGFPTIAKVDKKGILTDVSSMRSKEDLGKLLKVKVKKSPARRSPSAKKSPSDKALSKTISALLKKYM
jgi:hypothetical protein